jgi:hypothetical protein
MSIFYLQHSHISTRNSKEAESSLSEAEIAALIASGSYACLYLISSFSTVLAAFETLSELMALSQRVLELSDALVAGKRSRQQQQRWISTVKGCSVGHSSSGSSGGGRGVGVELSSAMERFWDTPSQSDTPSKDTFVDVPPSAGVGSGGGSITQCRSARLMLRVDGVNILQPLHYSTPRLPSGSPADTKPSERYISKGQGDGGLTPLLAGRKEAEAEGDEESATSLSSSSSNTSLLASSVVTVASSVRRTILIPHFKLRLYKGIYYAYIYTHNKIFLWLYC